MKKHRIYIETRNIIIFCINAITVFALLTCAILERKGIHIPASMFPIFALVGGTECAGTVLWVMMPYFKSKRAMALFASGYSFEGLFDETAPLNSEMEKAQSRIKEMIQSSLVLNISKRQAQFIALQNQINPHFLYNTLEGIRSEALCAGLSNVANIAEALSTFFRYTISQMESLVPLSMEIENTRGYFLIQQYRFGERLHLSIDFKDGCDADALECKLPKLTLQPIIENAIIHGIEGKTGEGHLTVTVTLTDERLIISVHDDGAGMDSKTLRDMQEHLEKSSFGDGTDGGESPYRGPSGYAFEDVQTVKKKGGIALRNVNNRIKIIFGAEYGLAVESTAGIGTNVRILLPRVKDLDKFQRDHETNINLNNAPAKYSRKEVLRMVDVYSPPYLTGLTFEVLSGEICGLLSIDHIGLMRFIDILLMKGHSPLVEHGTAALSGGCIVIGGASSSQLIDDMSIMENLFVVCNAGQEIINRKALRERTFRLINRFGLDVDPDTTAAALTPYKKAILLLAKAAASHAALVVLANITTFLTMDDTERVMLIVRELAADGLSFLYICNHHQEAFRYCDNLLIMENGKIARSMNRKEINGIIAQGAEATQMADYFCAAAKWVHDRIKEHTSVSEPAESIDTHGDAHRGNKSGTLNGKGTPLVKVHFNALEYTLCKGETAVVIDNDGVVLPPLVEYLNGKAHSDKSFMPRERGRAIHQIGNFSMDLSADAITVGGKAWQLSSRQCALIPAEPIRAALFPTMPLIDNLCFTIDHKLLHFWLTNAARRAISSDVRPIFGDAINASNLYGMDEATLYRIVYHRVLIQRPAVVFAVSPLSSADMATRLMILDYFDSFHAKGITTCILGYAASDVLAVADRLLVVGEGGSISREYERERFGEFNGVAGLRPM